MRGVLRGARGAVPEIPRPRGDVKGSRGGLVGEADLERRVALGHVRRERRGGRFLCDRDEVLFDNGVFPKPVRRGERHGVCAATAIDVGRVFLRAAEAVAKSPTPARYRQQHRRIAQKQGQRRAVILELHFQRRFAARRAYGEPRRGPAARQHGPGTRQHAQTGYTQSHETWLPGLSNASPQ